MSHKGKTQHRLFRSLFLVTFILSTLSAFAKYQTSTSDTLCLVEWNVENLFDCRHDTLKNDYEFLPESIRHWTYHRYKYKLDRISKVLINAGGWTPPALVALCEVENDSVMIALTRFSALKELKYRYVMTHSSDRRGIDVALMYQRDQFKLLGHDSIPIPSLKHFKPTRDILHVYGLVSTGDTLDIFIVHAPSRAGGALESEPYRLHFAQTLKNAVNNITQQRGTPHIIITGDFNDNPDSPSINEVLQAKAPTKNISNNKLYNLLAYYEEKHQGTYKFKDEWNLLDQILVSGTLLNNNASVYTNETLAHIIQFPYLFTTDKNYSGERPLRTYYGIKYEGGYSDHLPTMVKFILKD